MTTNAKVYSVSSPRLLVDNIPSLVGFYPHDSLVLVGLDANKRITVTLRVDLTACDEMSMLKRAVDAISASGPGARVISVIFSATAADVLDRPWIDYLASCGIDVADDMWCSGPRAGSFLCASDCCPFDTDPDWSCTYLALETRTPLSSRDALAASLAFVGPEIEAGDTPVTGEGPKLLLDAICSVTDPRSPVVGMMSSTFVSCCSVTDTSGWDGNRWLSRDTFLMEYAKGGQVVPRWFIEHIAAHTTDENVLVVLAVLVYLEGDGSATWVLLDRTGENTLAGLVKLALETAMHPQVIRGFLASA